MEEIEEIAIVGIGCRFPGANNIQDFWNVLVNGENHVKEIPRDRWNLDAIYDPDPDAYGKTYVRRAGLLSNHNVWDNDFFGIAEKEASEMDPQQRYVLECVHMALEDGGITRAELDGSSTSVYIGAMNNDSKTSKDGDYSLLTNYSVTGDAASIITARVSYYYNLLGPSLTIDTACSSSLVAVNLATQSLRIGESSMAICGGVNSILYPDMFVTLTKARMASPTGQCQAFSANADGYARGEGCGIIILERLSDALRNGRNIWATIRTGCNQDGHTAKPITAPSEIQQKQLLHNIYLNSFHINPSHVQYIEAHGTGTPVGDPIEVNSLGSFFKDYPILRDEVMKQRFIGSVKTNIGHLESGAGAASLIKTLLMMKHGRIVPSLHSLPRNPRIDFTHYGLDVPTSVRSWPALHDGTRAACINCFGFGGTNSHAFVRQWVEDPSNTSTRIIHDKDEIAYVPVSAKSQVSLINTLKHMATKLREEPCDLNQLAYTASCKRDHHRYRTLFIESSVKDLINSCNNGIDMLINSTLKPCKQHRLVYVFCGVGTAWTNMGMELVRDFPVFAKTLKSIDTYLAPLTGWSITDKLRDGAEMKDPFTSHIGIFACQIGISDLLKHWGICPDAIVGQSVGEVAAAYSSRVLSLGDAVKVIYYRSKILSEASGGKMAVITNVDTEKVARICNEVGDVVIAVYLSPVACTISGGEKQVTKVKSLLLEYSKSTNDIPFFHDLNVKCGYHSPMVETAAKRIRECLEGIEPKIPHTSIFSTVTGKIADEFATPEYWQRNVSAPVLFYQALQESTNNLSTLFLEIGPKPVLKAHLRTIFEEEDITAVSSMKTNIGSTQIHTMLRELYTLGMNPKWENLVMKNNLTNLPQYQFDGKHLLVESDYRFLRKQGFIDDSSGRYLMLTKKESKGEFKVNVSPNATPFVYDHVIDDVVIIPGAVYTEVALEIGMSVMGIPAECMQVEYDIIKAVPLTKGKPSYLDVTSNENETNDIAFSIFKDEVTVAKGFVRNRHNTHTPIIPVENVCVRSGTRMECQEIYKELAKHGYKYGQSVQILESITFNKDECSGYIHLTDEVESQINQTSFHPAILDAMLHSSALIFLSDKKGSSYKIYPIRFGNVSVFRSFEKRMVCYTRIIQEVYDRSITNIILTRPDGLVLAEIKEIEHQVMDGSMGVNTMAYQICWTTEDISSVINNSFDEAKPKVAIFYEDSGVHNILRTFYPRGESFRLSDLENNSASMISPSDIEDLDLFIFIPGSNVVHQSRSSDDVFCNVYKNCEAFLNIMKKLKDINKTVIIITENTQEGGSTSDIKKNIFGAELWGFTRSLRHEGIRCRMILIDVQPTIASEKVTLHNTITFLMSANATSTMECLIVDGQIHSNFLQRRQQSGLQTQHRILSTDTHLDLCLRSTKSDKIDRPFLIPEDRKNVSEKNHVTIQVDEICIQSSSGLCVTELDSGTNNSLWADYCENGYSVIGIEFIGTISGQKQSNRVVTCYQTRVANRVSVPEQFVCDLSSFRNYTPGLMSKSMLMWSIMQRVPSKSTVCIITDSGQSENTEATLLRNMLKTVKHCRVHVTSTSYLNDARYRENDVFVLFEKFSQHDIACVLRSGITVIGFEDEMSFLTSQVFQMSSRGINIDTITRGNSFDKKNTSFPKVSRWLKRYLERHDLSYNIGRSLKMQTIKLPGAKDFGKRDMKVQAVEDKLIHKNATYVVVGGLTGLGWEIVKWLGYQGAGIVVTLSRKGHNPQMKEQIQNAMDIHKYEIIPKKCDVSNYADVEKTFDEMRIQFPYHPIKGIFQGAGVLRDTLFENMTMDKFKEVLQPKVLGTWNLHLVSKGLLLDFFVMHSSTTSVFGNAGQTNYGAANSFLDSLAFYRRAQNLPGQSINWGALSVGMAKDDATRNNLEAQGFYVLEADKIKECLLDSLMRNPCQIIYGMFDWSVIGKNPAMMLNSASDKDELAKVGKITGQRRVVNTVVDHTKLMEAPFEEQRETLKDLLFSVISKVLSIDELELDKEFNLLSLGMESQKAVELIQEVKEATGCRLPVAYVLSPNYTIEMLIDFAHSNILDVVNMSATETSEIKDDVHGSLSWMEKFYIDMRENNAEDTSLWYSIDFKLGSGLSNIKIWQSVLRWITIKNPELRTLYLPTGQQFRFGMKKIVLDPEDAKIDLRCVDSQVMTRMTDKDIVKYCSFDITKDPPLRVLYCSTGKKHRIRFIVSHVSFDLQSFFTLVPQFRLYVLSYAFKKDIIVEPLKPLDIAVRMEESIDADRDYFENFWKGEIKRIRSVPSADGSQKPLPISEKTEEITLKLPYELVDKINSNYFDVTAPVLLFSLYRMLLQQVTHVSVVPIVMVVDMRRHFPEFMDRICLGTNYIPVITELNSSKATLGECIAVCSNQIMLASANSLYPFELIKQIDTNKQNCFRHFFNIRDISKQVTKNTQHSRYYMENVNHVTGFLNQIETALNVVTDRKAGSMELVLSYDSKSISSSQANRMLNDLSILAFAAVTNSDLQLNEVPVESCWTDSSPKIDEYMSTVTFMKETISGWEHPAHLKLSEVNNIHQIAWVNPDGNSTSEKSAIPMTCVIDVDTAKTCDFWCLIIQTTKRRYCFKTEDCFMAQAWRSRIRKIMSSYRNRSS